MSSKSVKNEQWNVKKLISKIENKEISKPKFQRKKKWDIQQKKETTPNERAYIQFLFEVQNSVHAITFGQNSDNTYSNIDGNNRINAITHFIRKPFEIFDEYLDDLFIYINKLTNLDGNDKILLNKIFKEISYNDIIDMKFNKYFESIKKNELYLGKLQIHRDNIEPIIEIIQNKLKINENERFDISTTINVNLFEGYTTDDLCKTFEDINKFNSQLSDVELLACRLYNITDFKINDSVLHKEIINEITIYYEEKSKNEVLNCFNFETDETINAFDCIIGLQNYCNRKYEIIEKSDNEGLSLFFKLYKSLYSFTQEDPQDKTKKETSFNTKNINEFIEYIIYASSILKKINEIIFTEKINNILFNKTCEKKINKFKKNNIYIILSAIIGYKKQNFPEKKIINSIEKAILYHFFNSEIKNKELRDSHKINDKINFEAGGTFIDALSSRLLFKDPYEISEKINKENMSEIIKILIDEMNNNIIKSSQSKRKLRKFFEKTLLFYYYKSKVPTNLLDNEFSLEHIFPFSSNWKDELDIDRLGNIVPIISQINNKRGNKHIKKYKELDINHDFIKFIDVIPDEKVYDNIILHKEKEKEKEKEILNIINLLYNNNCEKIEKKYLDNFIKYLFY